jgi:hypothetical protein
MKSKFTFQALVNKFLIGLFIFACLAGLHLGLFEPMHKDLLYAYTIVKHNGPYLGQVTVAGTVKIKAINGILVPPGPPYLGDPISHDFGTYTNATYSFQATQWGDTTALTMNLTCNTTYYTGTIGAVTTAAPGYSFPVTITAAFPTTAGTYTGSCFVNYSW